MPGVPLYLGSRSISHWINPAAFSLPAVGAWGDAGRNLVTGPPLWQDDSAIEKNFHLTERNNVIFRAEAFNIFNRAQYGQPSGSLSVTTKSGVRTLTVPASFGAITSTVNSAGLVGTGTPRVLEFSLRITDEENRDMKIKCSLILACAVALASHAAAHGEASPVTLVRTIYMPEIIGDFDHFTVDLKRGHLFVSAEVHHSIECSTSRQAIISRVLADSRRRTP